MSKEPNNIDRIVRKKLDGFEMTPPPSVWSATEAAMAQSGRKKRFFLWFFLGIGVIVFLTIGLYYVKKVGSEETQLAGEKTSKEKMEFTSKNSKTTINKLDQENETSRSETDDDDDDALSKADQFEYNNNSSSQNLSNSKTPSSLGSGNQKNGTVDESDSLRSSKPNFAKSNQGFDGDRQSKMSTPANSKSSMTINNFEAKPTNDLKSDVSKGEQHTNKINDLLLTQQFDSLPIFPLQLFTTENIEPVSSRIEEDSLPKITPFWKSISIEGSIGMSIFKNQPSKGTDAVFSNFLTQTASNQLSFDLRFGLNYHFTDHLSLQTGIHYNLSREDYVFNSSEITTYTYMDTVSFSIDTITMDTIYVVNPISFDSTTVVSNKGRNSYKIFTLPFQFAWSQAVSKRGILEFSIGGAISLYGRNSGSVIVDNSKFAIAAEEGYQTSGVLSVGSSIKYLHRFGDRHSVYVEPWAQFGVTNQSSPSLSYETFRRRLGIRLGYRFYL